ncbi:hypothetical protein JTB14_018895 [Gonioctena quinquepunctata]|nr:hypothetical protein JTB14_018895 [Gonioctena quinquepunctata]
MPEYKSSEDPIDNTDLSSDENAQSRRSRALIIPHTCINTVPEAQSILPDTNTESIAEYEQVENFRHFRLNLYYYRNKERSAYNIAEKNQTHLPTRRLENITSGQNFPYFQ